MQQDKIWDYFQNQGIESFSQSIPRLDFILKQAQKMGPNQIKTVLNIGVGNGWLEKQCLGLGWETYSLDPSETAINQLQKNGITGKIGYIESIPYDDNFFDFVFCSEVIEHLSDKQINLGLEEIKRVLKNKGYLIGTVPFNENLIDNQVVCPDCGKNFHRWGHLQSFDKNKIKNLLTLHQLEIIILDTYAFPDFTRKKFFDQIKSYTRYWLGRQGIAIAIPNLVFIAKKNS